MSQRKAEVSLFPVQNYRRRLYELIVESCGEENFIPLDDLEKTVLLCLMEGATRGPAVPQKSRPDVHIGDVKIKQYGELTREQAESNALMISACWNDVARLLLEIDIYKKAIADVVLKAKSASNGALVDHRKVLSSIQESLEETFSLKE